MEKSNLSLEQYALFDLNKNVCKETKKLFEEFGLIKRPFKKIYFLNHVEIHYKNLLKEENIPKSTGGFSRETNKHTQIILLADKKEEAQRLFDMLKQYCCSNEEKFHAIIKADYQKFK